MSSQRVTPYGSGSSPHTRGARSAGVSGAFNRRIIPAYAGSTSCPHGPSPHFLDHPRIRGEHVYRTSVRDEIPGSSPHTRGAHQRRRKHRREGRDHPRIRGEHLRRGMPPPTGGGSSPHTRGAPRETFADAEADRIIPAYAGSTCTTSYGPFS